MGGFGPPRTPPNAAFFATLESFVCLEADAYSLLLHCTFSFCSEVSSFRLQDLSLNLNLQPQPQFT